MAKLIYFSNVSLNGYTTDDEGKFDFTEPDDEVHSFINDALRDVGTHVYGRRMYETMMVWETEPKLAEESPINRDFAGIWKGVEKIVYSSTLPTVQTTRTRLEREFDPEAVRRMVATSDRDMLIGGPTLAAHAFRAGLIDECHLLVIPIIIRAGTKSLPDDVRFELQLIETREFGNGTVYLRYGRRGPRKLIGDLPD
jgi:dihydrofolate reductase